MANKPFIRLYKKPGYAGVNRNKGTCKGIRLNRRRIPDGLGRKEKRLIDGVWTTYYTGNEGLE